MNKKISLGAAIAFTVIMVAMTYSVTMVSSMGNFNDKVNNLRERESFYSKLAEIDSITRQNYIGTIDELLLMNEEAKGFIAGLDDPYAAYYDAAAYDRLLQDYSGDRVQIGIVTKMNEEGLSLIHICGRTRGEILQPAGDLACFHQTVLRREV